VDLELEDKNFSESREENFATLLRVTLMGIRTELGGAASL
jgi:hypothetical protein